MKMIMRKPVIFRGSFRGYCDQEYDIREMNQQFDYSLKESYINGRY